MRSIHVPIPRMLLRKYSTGKTFGFLGKPLNRLNNQRREADFFNESVKNPNARLLLFDDDMKVLAQSPVTGHAAWQQLDQWVDRLRGVAEEDLILLGSSKLDGDEGPLFAASIRAFNAKLPPDAAFVSVRNIAGLLRDHDAAAVCQGRALLQWHSWNKYCSRCGAPSKPSMSGSQRTCTACATHLHYARTDPVVIMLVHRGDRCLLGRQSVWEPRRFSTLAGYVEPGETMEAAVSREVFEESGILVDPEHVNYIASQPWPFPHSLMLGCLARAASEHISIDKQELDDARWFSKKEVAEALNDTSTSLTLPHSYAISRHLIAKWALGS